MRHHATSEKNVVIKYKTLAPVFPIRFANRKSIKQHGKVKNDRNKKDMPLFYTEPIFKAKEHDPL